MTKDGVGLGIDAGIGEFPGEVRRRVGAVPPLVAVQAYEDVVGLLARRPHPPQVALQVPGVARRVGPELLT
jgi:hypothetical protein